MSQKFSWVVRMAGLSAVFGMLAIAGVAYAVVPILSQANVTVGLGQTLTVTSQNSVSMYMELNSNPTIASVSVNGTQIAVTGSAPGTTAVTICAVGTASDCATLGVTVQTASVSGISFNPSNVSFSVGGSQLVTISGGNGTYTLSNNSNTSVVSTSLSGNSLTVSGIAAGTATLTICDTSNTCGTLSVTINAAAASGLTFGQNNISMAAGVNQTVSISGGTGSYTITNISNPSIVSAGTSSNGVAVVAISSGTATITVCDTSNVCGTLSVTVTGSPSGSQAVMFNPTNPTVAVGQNVNVAVSGNAATSFFILSNSSASAIQASMSNNNTLAIYGAEAGTGSLTICAVGGSGCASLSVTVTGPAAIAATTVPTATTQTTIVAPTAQGTASMVANAALLAEIQTLQTAVTQVLTQIQSIQTQLSQLQAQVNAGSGSSISTSVGSAANTSSGNFTELLTLGSQDAQVTALQNRLAALGFYSGPVTGYYGSLTQSAVVKYQTAHGISATGSLGPSTRSALNAGN